MLWMPPHLPPAGHERAPAGCLLLNETPLVRVQLIGMPLQLMRTASEHNDGLKREFAFLAAQADADPEGVPARLITLSKELDERFQAFSAGPTAEMQQAMDRGDEEIDLVFVIPPAVAEGAQMLAGLLEEADAYCAAGKEMLTLVATGDVVVYRNWVLEEFVRQVNGEEPRPWITVARSA